MNKIDKSITELVKNKINNINQFKDEIIDSLHLLLNGNYNKYNINETIINNTNIELSDENFQNILAHMNEKTNKRKSNGVYYTPNDVSKYIICNTFINRMFPLNKKTYNLKDSIKELNKLEKKELNKLLYEMEVIDPTCGSGEFLLNVLDIKLELLNNEFNDDDILNICSTIYGNDIDEQSNDISKIRLFFFVANKLKKATSFKKLVNILKNQFFNVDFVIDNKEINKKFDIVVGNPPYIEYGKFSRKSELINQYGNVYADVLKNSIDMLKDNGTMGYIIPLSYISTSRMQKIREYIISNMSKQFILNFADRPDCLFNGVHQKLNILISCKGNQKHEIFTSNYKHWYKEERNKLLNGREVIKCIPVSDQFIPKLGNTIEKNIFYKVYALDKNNIINAQWLTGKELYLNMRACFWIKAFSFNPGSNEYKKFIYDSSIYSFVLCLLNSSLFWIYWTIMSDCWHITTKELNSFYIPEKLDNISIFDNLAIQLEERLEQTKKYVGTKQVDYEYKHKFCKDIIDNIDNELAKIYKLTDKELEYIKNFALLYRVGGNND